jgi:phosphoribosyl 1,2-cyclic phosphodiesterase
MERSMEITALASGSSGNSYLVRTEDTAILVDAGLSCKQIRERLTPLGTEPQDLKAVLVSHGHADHTKGVGVLSRKFKVPVWMNEGTWKEAGESIGEVHRIEFFQTGRLFQTAGLKVHPFSTPHDSADPVGFRISQNGSAIGIATDLGVVTNLVANVMAGVQVAVVESNHDPIMLRDGPYPWDLKQRVAGRRGHLSNADGATLLQRIFSDQLQAVMLAHLSETNNQVRLAMEAAQGALKEFLACGGALHCATQHQVGPTIRCR